MTESGHTCCIVGPAPRGTDSLPHRLKTVKEIQAFRGRSLDSREAEAIVTCGGKEPWADTFREPCMSGTPEHEGRGRPRRPVLALTATVALVAVVVGIARTPSVRVRYYLWQLERAYEALPASSPATCTQFATVMHYQKKLGGVGEAAVEPLLATRHEHDHLWYWVVTTVVGGLRSGAAEDALVSDTRSQDPTIARQALQILAALPELHCQEHVLTLLSHPSAEVRGTAVGLVTDHRIRDVYPLVVDMLQSDPAPMVRALSARGAATLGGNKAIPLLIDALDDPGVTRALPPMTVRSAVRFWLQALTHEAFQDKDQWQRWWRENSDRYTHAAPISDGALTSCIGGPETTCPRPHVGIA